MICWSASPFIDLFVTAISHQIAVFTIVTLDLLPSYIQSFVQAFNQLVNHFKSFMSEVCMYWSQVDLVLSLFIRR